MVWAGMHLSADGGGGTGGYLAHFQFFVNFQDFVNNCATTSICRHSDAHGPFYHPKVLLGKLPTTFQHKSGHLELPLWHFVATLEPKFPNFGTFGTFGTFCL